MSPWKKDNLKFLLDKLAKYPDHFKIVDVGVGDDPFREATARFKDIVKMDIVPHSTVNMVYDFNKKLPFKADHFNCVIVANVLEHCSDPVKLLAEIYRVLKPGGALIGTVPFLIHIHQEPYDYFRYTEYALHKLFRNAEFKFDQVYIIGNLASIYENFQGLFFWRLLNSPLSVFKKILIKIIWKGQKILLSLMRSVYNLCVEDEKMVQGYGFVAEK